MPLIPVLVGTIVGLFLTFVTGYFLFIIFLSEQQDHHRPIVLQAQSDEANADPVTQS